MQLLKLYSRLLMIMLAVLFTFTACEKDDNPVDSTPAINEAEVLVKYLEANGDYINTTTTSIVPATTVYTNLTSGTQYIIDIRDTTAFKTGHIQGAVRVDFVNLLDHVKTVPTSYTSIVVVCYSGQTAAYGTSLLRLLGYSRVSSMKWGMASWDSLFASTTWISKLSNQYASQMSTTAAAKGAKGNLPTLNTGKTTGQEILEARASALFAQGFSAATVSASTVFGNLANYYIVNYWPVDQYNAGHIPGAIQYMKPDFRDTVNLRTLPIDKPVAVYCYTGQTSAFLAAYLKVLGYDAKTLLYGANNMMYDNMPANKFVATEIKGYPYVTGN